MDEAVDGCIGIVDCSVSNGKGQYLNIHHGVACTSESLPSQIHNWLQWRDSSSYHQKSSNSTTATSFESSKVTPNIVAPLSRAIDQRAELLKQLGCHWLIAFVSRLSTEWMLCATAEPPVILHQSLAASSSSSGILWLLCWGLTCE